jgi:cytochrome c oxidase subunit II
MPPLPQSMLVTAGSQAASIEKLWWIEFWAAVAVFAAVVIGLVLAVLAGRSGQRPLPSSRVMASNVVIASAISFAILVLLLGASMAAGRSVTTLVDPAPLEIQITGHQWWWQVEYWSNDPAKRLSDANELHVPVGRVVALTLTSDDVIHSFWVPAMHGKMDLIPGRKNTLWLKADRAGEFAGQCAEYCGLQHAHMRLVFIAQEPADFERWVAGTRQSANPPELAAVEARGRELVTRGPCSMCHTVSGTDAGGHTAPDLTHIGSRRTIAAGTLANTPENLTKWIGDPQSFKPGTRMPKVGLVDADIQAVVAFLERLK